MFSLKIISYTGYILLFINTIIYFIGFAGKSRAYKFFTFYLLGICAVQFIMESYATRNANNHFLSTYYLFIQYIVLSCFFYYVFEDCNKKISRVIKYITVPVLVVLAIQYIREPELYYVFNSFGFLMTAIILILYAVLYLYELISNKLPFYYITAGIFIYLIGISLIFATAAEIVSIAADVGMYIWKINSIIFIAYQLLILYEWKKTFYQKATKQRSY
ncbi:hypothetical protein AAEO56_00555 [Flavobacterium sp. DGU11]|uniref:YhhN-like protein n=1 Tax=Flavobacterium arundinis TaxID=3139143 RepID=A0ABU9HRE6_9FLAO